MSKLIQHTIKACRTFVDVLTREDARDINSAHDLISGGHNLHKVFNRVEELLGEVEDPGAYNMPFKLLLKHSMALVATSYVVENGVDKETAEKTEEMLSIINMINEHHAGTALLLGLSSTMMAAGFCLGVEDAKNVCGGPNANEDPS